jgi:hypothetical protein
VQIKYYSGKRGEKMHKHLLRPLLNGQISQRFRYRQVKKNNNKKQRKPKKKKTSKKHPTESLLSVQDIT